MVATDAAIELDGRKRRRSRRSTLPVSGQREAMLTNCTFLWPAIRRAALERAGGYDESFVVMQDWELFARLVLGGAAVAYVREPLYRWRLTPGSRSSRDRVENVAAMLRMTRRSVRTARCSPGERSLCELLIADRRRWLVRERARHALQERERGARAARSRSSRGAVRSGDASQGAGRGPLASLARRFLARRSEQADPAVAALAQRGF